MKELAGVDAVGTSLYGNCSKDDRRVEQRPPHMEMSLLSTAMLGAHHKTDSDHL